MFVGAVGHARRLATVVGGNLDELLAVALYDGYLNSDLATSADIENRFSRALTEASAPQCYMAHR